MNWAWLAGVLAVVFSAGAMAQEDPQRAYAMAWKAQLADFYYTPVRDRKGKALVGRIRQAESAWVQCNGCAEDASIKTELAAARKAARDEGLIVPRTEMRAAIFGAVPDSFNPAVPPPEYLQREPELAVMMEKSGEGALTQIRLKTVDEWVYQYVLPSRQDFLRKELPDAEIGKMEAMGSAAKGMSGAFVLECSYRQGNGLLKSSAFWWEARPDGPADQVKLIESGAQSFNKRGSPAGKIIPIGGARTQCPDEW